LKVMGCHWMRWVVHGDSDFSDHVAVEDRHATHARAAPRTCRRAFSQSVLLMFFICPMAALIMPGSMPRMPAIMDCICSGLMRRCAVFVCAAGCGVV
jgi:hypothetical protein